MRYINYLKDLLIVLMAGTFMGCLIAGYLPEANISILIYKVVLFGVITGLGIYWMVSDLRR